MKWKSLLFAASLVMGFCSGSLGQYQPISEQEKGKPLTYSLYLREEYDDNVFTSGTDQVEVFRSLVEPSIVLNYPMDRTLLSARYTFGMSYFVDRPGDDVDFSQDFVGRVAHTFSPRFDVDFRDRFRMGFEPDLKDGGTSYRSNGDYWNNEFTAFGRAQWVPRFGNTLEYTNKMVDYDEALISTQQDRMEHMVNFENRLQVLPTTVATLGYRFSRIGYNDRIKTSDAEMAEFRARDIDYPEYSDRDSTGHYFLIGADHRLLPTWTVSARAGVEARVYDGGGDTLNPYFSLATFWEYLPKSTLSLSYTYSSDVTDITSYSTQEAQSIKLDIVYAITAKLFARNSTGITFGHYSSDNVATRLQDIQGDIKSRYREYWDSNIKPMLTQEFEEQTYYTEFALGYQINPYLSAEIGYIYAGLQSDYVGRDYDRNRYYVGVRGTY
jgi:hypothetical protein